jgi:hypothetical protein
MDNSLKYDPLHTFRFGNERSKAIDNLMSVKVESTLEDKIRTLMQTLITTEDENLSKQLGIEINNTLKDIEDLKKSREVSFRRMNEGNTNV